jgi:K+/H+ antiporter YhaU regulatory subunit KhtT
VSIVAVLRDNELITNPSPEFKFSVNDEIGVLNVPEQLDRFLSLYDLHPV